MERRPSSRSTSRDTRRRHSPDSPVRLPRFPSSSPRSSARWRSCAWNAAPLWATRSSMPRSAKSRSSRSRSGAPGRSLPPGSARCRRQRIPETFMRRWAERSRPAILLIISAASLFAGFAAATANAADELAVDVVNASEPTLCAEHDNVTLKLASDKVRRFGIEAAHPAYIGTLVADRAAADFSQCDFAVDPGAARKPERVTLYESQEWQLIGHRLDAFWPPAAGPVPARDRLETRVPLLQLLHRFEERGGGAGGGGGGKDGRQGRGARFERGGGADRGAGRAAPPRHNSSAPDLRFSAFGATPR